MATDAVVAGIGDIWELGVGGEGWEEEYEIDGEAEEGRLWWGFW